MHFSRPLSELSEEEQEELSAQKKAALGFILDAWEEAICEGVDTDLLANAALFTALSDLVGTYGEEAVAEMTESLPRRVRYGEFTLKRVTQ